jgi:NADPH:quinone reductase-like Zn-dependent oxidoreductase
MMKAAIVESPGAVPRWGDFAEPEPATGETEMTVLAAGIHPIVRSLAAGTHYGSTGGYPLVPGVDCVAQGADGVPRYAGYIRAPWGTLAERIAARMGLPLPDGADPVMIAGSMNPGLSSWLPLVARTREVESLGTVLVVGATGVAGRIAVQNAFALGADRVVGIGRDRGRLADVTSLGASAVALDDGASAVADALAGTSPSIVLDYLWGPPAELVWDALAGHGLDEDDADILHVQIGTTAGARASLPGAILRSRRLTVRGSGAGSASLEEIMAQLPVFMAKVASGDVVAPVRAFPLSDVAEAWGSSDGERVVVVPD